MPSILLTRPQAASERLAFALAALGYGGAIDPLLTIAPITNAPPDLDGLQAVMLTSAHALEVLDRASAEAEGLLKRPCFCVGSRTAEAARQFGFVDLYDAAGDGPKLAEAFERALKPQNGAILHIAGLHTDGKAEEELRRSGFDLRRWVVYEAVASSSLSYTTVRLFHESKIDAVLVFSARSADTLKALLRHHALEAACADVIALGISAAVLPPLAGISWRRLDAAPEPTEDAVIRRLQELLPVAEV